MTMTLSLIDAIAQFWRSFKTYFLLILDTFHPICNVSFKKQYSCSFHGVTLWSCSSNIVNNASTVSRKATIKMRKLTATL